MIKKRFIAGAICPECGEQDTISVEMLDGVPQSRRCVRCGFSDTGAETGANVPRGRLEKPVPSQNEPVQSVRILDPSKPD